MSLSIYYGSETGTAHDVAVSIWRECRQREIAARVNGLDGMDVMNLPSSSLSLFIIATSGQGEMPTNMRETWKKLLKKSLSKDWLKGVSVAVVALGDSSYSKYNFAGKKIFRRLLQLGSSSLLPICLCDDQHELGIDGALDPFKQSLFQLLKEQFFPNSVSVDPTKSLPPLYTMKFVEDTISPLPAGDYVPVQVLHNERVTASTHFQDTRLVRFAIGEYEEQLQYHPGDVLMVHPENPEESVKIAVESLGYSDELLDRPFLLIPSDDNIKLPPQWITGSVTSLRRCFSRLFDLQHIPRKSFFEILGSVSTDETEKERLLELARPEMLDELLDYTTRARRTAAETLRDFYRTSSNLPPERLFDVFPTIRPRAFSIASCPETHRGHIELLVAKVEYKARMAEMRRGLCSTFISRMKQGDTVFVRVRPGTFRFPPPSTTVICVGPGTGVAPFRSLINYRHKVTPHPSPSLLFFGCRSQHRDFYFSIEWEGLHANALHPAFSRDQTEKLYVQDVIDQNSAKCWEFIASGAFIFIAGSSGDMPKAVCAALDRIGSINGMDNLVDQLEKAGRIQYETWS